MAFYPVNFESGRLISMPTAASVTTTIGGAAKDNGSGYLTNAAADDNTEVRYIFWQATTTGASAGDEILCYKVDESVRIHADCEDAPAQTDVGTFCDLAGSASLDPDSSTDDLFYIEKIDLADGAVGTSTKVYGYFTSGVPNS